MHDARWLTVCVKSVRLKAVVAMDEAQLVADAAPQVVAVVALQAVCKGKLMAKATAV